MTILITGASGNLGRKLHHHLAGSYELRLLDINPREDDRIIKADLSTWQPSWVRHFVGVDTVVHLAADPNPTRSWQEMLRPNFDTFVHVFNAAVQGGAKRIIFASSNHVMGGYRDNDMPRLLQGDTPPLPGLLYGENEQYDTTPYGAFKLAAERLGKCYADIHNISFIAVRIGYIKHDDNSAANFQNEAPWGRQMWLSDHDYCQLMQCCIEADPTLRFAVVNGMSANVGMRWDVAEAERLVGYVPQDGLDD